MMARDTIPISNSTRVPFTTTHGPTHPNPNPTESLHHHPPPSNSDAPPPLPKKKRNLPGTPDPEAEVITLSPTTLMATNRFVCEICNKGFQRDQNLQLHRRGHNLPWKLKQRANKEVRKKVYVCPEKSCVHHDPSRALGDLTGIKKHFSRKHGEKKWKCDKCSKKYAVQSDWKAHVKTCGTREYKCDCGTIFSRKDSFITHRAFCDALTEESMRFSSSTALAQANKESTNTISLSCNQQSGVVLEPNYGQNLYMQNHIIGDRQDQKAELPLWLDRQGTSNATYFNPVVPPSTGSGVDLLAPVYSSTTNNIVVNEADSIFMSATALLQKAAQMGAVVSNPSSSMLAGLGRGLMGSMKGSHFRKNIESPIAAMGNINPVSETMPLPMSSALEMNGMNWGGEVGSNLTRDFLGLGGEDDSCLARITSMGGGMDFINTSYGCRR